MNNLQLQRGELKFDRLIRKLQLQDADLHKEQGEVKQRRNAIGRKNDTKLQSKRVSNK